MKSLIKVAVAELGIKEIPGQKNEKRILEYATESGFKGIGDDETPWCSIFVNWCCEQAGLQRTHRANARSWLAVGLPVTDPVPGDIVVFWRESLNSWKGHVGIFMGYSKNRTKVFSLGGNQRNTVSIQAYDASTVLGFRRLTYDILPSTPDATKILELGSQGENVKKLQAILGELNYDCGAADGVFGPKTEAKLKAFQRDQGVEQPDGIYGPETKILIDTIFQT